MAGRPKLKKETVSIGITITVTKTEKKFIDRVTKEKNISRNQYFRDILKEKIKEDNKK